MQMNKKGLYLALALISSLFAVVILLINANTTRSADRDSEFNQQVRNAIAEFSLPPTGDNSSTMVGAANLSGFINYRSGVLLSDHNLGELSEAEGLALNGSKKISKQQLTEILTEIAARKLRYMTEAQLGSAVNALRGFEHPSLPESFKHGRRFATLRADGTGRMTYQEMSAQLDRLSASRAGDRLARTLARNAIALEIESVCSILADADRDFFVDSGCSMTPMQAFLVAYAVVTDDLLAGNRADISVKMRKIQEAASSESGEEYPGPEGFTPYGKNGYIFSTPADLLLDEESVTGLISKLKEIVE